MSYDIVYAREFIKTACGNIIPLVLCGSNNCYDVHNGRERRERHWATFFLNKDGKIAYTPEELMAKVKACVPSRYQEHFVRNGKWVNDKAFVRFFENGIKKAKTIEELKAELLYFPSLEGYMIAFPKNAEEKRYTYPVRDSNSLEEFLNTAQRLVAKHADIKEVCVGLYFKQDDVLKRPYKPKPRKEKRNNNYYVIRVCGNHYVSGLTRSGLYHTHSVGFAKQFKSESEANKWIRDRNLVKRFYRLSFEVEYVA